MLANGIKQISSTGGAGALTLASAGGSVPLSLAFALGQLFAYSIYTGGDGAPVFREAGFGYLSASNTLVRARVAATFDGASSYNTSNPTATDFGGATLTVICTPHAASLESALPTVDGQSASVGRLVTSAARTTTTSGAQIFTGDISYVPFLLKVGAPVVSLAVNVTTASTAGTFIRAGVYACTEKGYVGGLLATTGNLDAGSTGLKVGVLATPVFLPPGWYFTAVTTNSSPTITAYTSGSGNMLGAQPFGWSATSIGVPIDFRVETGGVNSVLPATASATTSARNVGVAHLPLAFLGVQ